MMSHCPVSGAMTLWGMMKSGERKDAVMKEKQKDKQRAGVSIIRVALITAVITAGVAFGVTALLINIFERKQEAQNPFFRVVELTDKTVDPAIWGKNFPFQYDAYKQTVDMVRTRFGGSEAMPRVPTDADPRSVVSQSRIVEDPRLKVMWAGYSFAVDFREERGHAYMLEDQTLTQRQRVVDQPGTCIHCHASTYVAYKELGNGDIFAGFEALNQMPYDEARGYVEHPVACIDCHDPDTMQLRITRPAFLEGIRAWKASGGVEEYDPNTMASRQEMRSYVCGQCHSEYYFAGKEKRLVFPWSNGLKADEILAYYEEKDFKDWTHADTGAASLKAQHPEFEMWNQGIHSRSGVACADCHMPYIRVGAMKISDHHVRSPLLNVNHACQTCHRFSEEELKSRAEDIQLKTLQMRDIALDALVELIGDIEVAQVDGIGEQKLQQARQYQRKAQFLIDYVEVENSAGFHAAQETARVLNLSLEYCREGQLVLRG
jgi:nitrite reductase (cytochrome c-552)